MTLYQALTPARSTNKVLAPVTLVCAVALLVISAKLAIPFYPVPMTMHTLAVLVLGFALGSRLGVAAMVSYLAIGAMGFPVFTGTPEKGIGLAYLAGPSGGYLLGMIPAIWLMGHLAEKGWDRSFLKGAVAALTASAIVYVPGLLYLGALIGWDKPVLELGFYPFVLGDVFKSLLVAAAFAAGWRTLRRKEGA